MWAGWRLALTQTAAAFKMGFRGKSVSNDDSTTYMQKNRNGSPDPTLQIRVTMRSFPSQKCDAWAMQVEKKDRMNCGYYWNYSWDFERPMSLREATAGILVRDSAFQAV